MILAFLISRQVLLHIYKKERKPLKDVATLSFYLVMATLVGARLGHVIFYEPELIWSKALSILLPFEFEPGFHLLGREEFSIHGATLGILIFLWLYSRKNKLQQNYLQIVDRVAIVATLSGVFILMGSFFNSEVTGKPTDSSSGAIFIKPVMKGLLKVPCCIMRSPDGKNPLDNIAVKKDPASLKSETSHKSIILYLFFKPGASEQLVNEFLIGDVKAYLYDMAKFVHEPGTEPLHYTIFLEKDGNYVARIKTLGIARHLVQIFEAFSCLLLFAFLFAYWHKYKASTPPGRLFGLFMLIFWIFHFTCQYLKETDISFATGRPFSTVFILNILFILIGVVVLAFSYRRATTVQA